MQDVVAVDEVMLERGGDVQAREADQGPAAHPVERTEQDLPARFRSERMGKLEQAEHDRGQPECRGRREKPAADGQAQH